MTSSKLIPGLLLFSLSCTAQSIDSLIQLRVDHGETPGIAVAFFEKGKTTYYSRGLANIEKNEKVTSSTLFEIGSITKTFTTTVAALMIDRGQLGLEDPIQKFFPPAVKIPEKSGKQITIENLATARSGLPRMPDNFAPADPANPYIDYTPASLTDFLQHYTLPREIGNQYEYSNLGMGLLGYVLTVQSHKTYSQLIEEWITKPLKMNNTLLNTPQKDALPHAQGYAGTAPAKAWTWNDQSVLAPAGGLLSSAEDMMKYVAANLTPPPSFAKAMMLAHTPRHDAGSKTLQIGLGWHILNSNIVWHNGGTAGFRTFIGFDPTSQRGVVVLTNSATGADDLGFYLLDHSNPLKTLHSVTTVDEKMLKEYVGLYEMTPAFSIDITQAGASLFLQATGQSKFELFPESSKRFFLKVVDAQIEFVRDDAGKVEKLLLYQNGAIQQARKVK